MTMGSLSTRGHFDHLMHVLGNEPAYEADGAAYFQALAAQGRTLPGISTDNRKTLGRLGSGPGKKGNAALVM